MIETPFYSIILSLLPCVIPPYALRLSRVFGTKRVGWVLFAVFTLLAGLQIVRSWRPLGVGLDPGLTLDLLYFLIPVLLLVGMVHIETLFKERLRIEHQEKQLRAELEMQVRLRTAELDNANEVLQREISLRKQGEEELRKSKEQYRVLFDENPQPMWIFDLQSFRFLAFNTAALRHYGFSLAEFRNLSAKDLCLPDELELFVADCIQTEQRPQRGSWRHCKKDGSIIEVELSTLDLTYAGCAARLVLANDVTAQRLLQKQLLQSQKTEVTTSLVGGIADNFSKLLTVIEGDANALVERIENPTDAEPLKRIAANAGCAAGLTRQLLALVRRHPIRPRALDLNQFVENHATAVSRMIGNQITLQKSFWTNLPSINADPDLIGQILRNLVLNAKDAMPKGGVLTISTAAVKIDEIKARRHEGAQAGPHVCLSVSDNGCGMSPEAQARLFEPFFTTKPGKAGLGLATIHGLVKQHYGWVEVASEVGAGSRFTVFFPCVWRME
jgi:two-component system, cell cycle sensor histidine kinase and response regulator CckA